MVPKLLRRALPVVLLLSTLACLALSVGADGIGPN